MCEEAHAYIPRDSDSQFAGSRRSMERIAKKGRKYGVGLAVVSQRPHEVSETVLAQCGTFICLRITNPNDQGYVRSLVPESEGDLVSILAGLGRGEALVLGEAVPLPTRVQFEKPNPTPNSDDVDFYGKWTMWSGRLGCGRNCQAVAQLGEMIGLGNSGAHIGTSNNRLLRRRSLKLQKQATLQTIPLFA